MKLKKPCPFLDGNRCAVHAFKPLNCILFPEYNIMAGMLPEMRRNGAFRPFPSLEHGFGNPALKQRTRKYCSLCGSIKRYFLNRATRTLGYDVLVTGHNLDDEASALLGNVKTWSIKYMGRKIRV